MHTKVSLRVYGSGLWALTISKMILGLVKSREKNDDSDSDIEIVDAGGKKEADPIAWAYVGSHNFTPSAWGNVSGSAFNPVVNVSLFLVQV